LLALTFRRDFASQLIAGIAQRQELTPPNGVRKGKQTHHTIWRSDMTTEPKTKAKSSRGKAQGKKPAGGEGGATNAIELLKKDHREVKGWFEEYEEATTDDEKAELSSKICLALKVHAQIEEEIFYPQAREAVANDDLLDQALVEHAGAKQLIGQIESMTVGDELYDAKVKVLGEQINHHVEDEEEELFPEVEDCDFDLDELGKKMASRKAELMAEMKKSGAAARVR
jgi:hemerythrin superfamily protein